MSLNRKLAGTALWKRGRQARIAPLHFGRCPCRGVIRLRRGRAGRARSKTWSFHKSNVVARTSRFLIFALLFAAAVVFRPNGTGA